VISGKAPLRVPSASKRLRGASIAVRVVATGYHEGPARKRLRGQIKEGGRVRPREGRSAGIGRSDEERSGNGSLSLAHPFGNCPAPEAVSDQDYAVGMR
jgi:hypothetical protein